MGDMQRRVVVCRRYRRRGNLRLEMHYGHRDLYSGSSRDPSEDLSNGSSGERMTPPADSAVEEVSAAKIFSPS